MNATVYMLIPMIDCGVFVRVLYVLTGFKRVFYVWISWYNEPQSSLYFIVF